MVLVIFNSENFNTTVIFTAISYDDFHEFRLNLKGAKFHRLACFLNLFLLHLYFLWLWSFLHRHFLKNIKPAANNFGQEKKRIIKNYSTYRLYMVLKVLSMLYMFHMLLFRNANCIKQFHYYCEVQWKFDISNVLILTDIV